MGIGEKMVNLPEEELKDWLEEASKDIEVGATYRHYKLGKLYKVTGLGIIESTNAPAVIYQAQYGQNLVFIRPAREWAEEVEQAGRQMLRFTKVEQSASGEEQA